MEQIPPLLADALKTLAGTLIGLIPYAVTTYRNRKKSALEDAEVSARTDLTRTNIQVATGETVSKMLTTLIEAGDTIKQLQDRVFELEQEAIIARISKLSLRKAKALLDYHQIPFSEADEPEVKKIVERTSKG